MKFLGIALASIVMAVAIALVAIIFAVIIILLISLPLGVLHG